MSARSSAEKTPKIKGIVKRCRSFKEDIMSRLARNRSIGGENNVRNVASPSGGVGGGWTSGTTSPVPTDPDIISDPVLLVSHRLKEAYLTLQFVESLIQKNCVDLLGGSSNVMLDLMGCLLNDIKKMSASDSAAYQGAVSQIKSALSDFLTSVDVLLLQDPSSDEAQRQVYFHKLLDTLKVTREALTRLKSLVETKENGHGGSVRHHSTSHLHNHPSGGGGTTTNGGGGLIPQPLMTSTPNRLPHSPSTKSDCSSTSSPFGGGGGSRFSPARHHHHPQSLLATTGGTSTTTATDSPEEKKPPLPPKLKQWSARSFDMEWPVESSTNSTRTTSPGPYSPSQGSSIGVGVSSSSHNLSPHHQSLLTQWLEQSSTAGGGNLTGGGHISSAASSVSSSTNNSNVHHHHHQRSHSQHHYHHHHQRSHLHSASSASKFDSSSHLGGEGRREGGGASWTESAIYVSRSTSGGSSGSKLLVTSSLLNLEQNKQRGGGSKLHALSHHSHQQRTYSDSYQLEADSEESLDKLGSGSGLVLVDDGEDDAFDSEGGGGGRRSANTTHNSQSLSLGSSLDNLLLVDGGVSPNHSYRGGGGGGSSSNSRAGHHSHNNQHRISVSSNISGSGTHGLASLSNYDPETDPDGDSVFVVEGQGSSPSPGLPKLVNNGTEGEDEEEGPPPSLPEKVNRRHFLLGVEGGGRRCPSPYENVDETDLATWHGTTTQQQISSMQQQHQIQQGRTYMSYSESRNTLVGGQQGDYGGEERPPLPPKKKHSLIAAYVEFLANFESFSQTHHHNHFHNHLNQIHHQHQQQQTLEGVMIAGDAARRHQFRSERSATLHNPGGVSPFAASAVAGITKSSAFSTSVHQFSSFSSSFFSPTTEEPPHPPRSPSAGFLQGGNNIQGLSSPTSTSGQSSGSYENNSEESPTSSSGGGGPPPELPPKKGHNNSYLLLRPSNSDHNSLSSSGHNNHPQHLSPSGSASGRLTDSSPVFESQERLSSNNASPSRVIPTVITPHMTPNNSLESPVGAVVTVPVGESNNEFLYVLDAYPMLTPNESGAHHHGSTSSSSSKSNSDGPEIKGGEPQLLIVYAASPELKDLRFREVFLLTYRTFVRPVDVVNLLWRRYQHFEKKTDRPSLVHGRATLDLFVDVVNSLTPMDLEDEMVEKLRNCIYHLVSCGEIQSALKARKGLIVKYAIRQKLLSPKLPPAALAVSSEAQSLLQWSATSIAQNMTLLDAELFRQLEPAELLLWAREQSEDFCPALNNFTEHFNKVSYWARSKVLLCANSRERNRTMKKLIEVMRKLREYNNFNSLLAVLAALDSAPIRRLGFSRRLTEALKPHAALTDSSGSFRTYRQALAESKPPCIPYIGLVLQDLTFVHIGNADFLADGKVNWVKRWQQWVVLEPVRRFHACQYGFVRNDPLLTFLNNFDESLNDDELWQLSESIKPRGKS